MENFSMMTINEVVLKSKSKKEVYDLMTTKGYISSSIGRHTL